MNAPGLGPVLRASDFGRPDLDIAGELETFDSKHASGGGFDRGSRLLRACLSDVHIITIEKVCPFGVLERDDGPIASECRSSCDLLSVFV
jgi:hypothetical protein